MGRVPAANGHSNRRWQTSGALDTMSRRALRTWSPAAPEYRESPTDETRFGRHDDPRRDAGGRARQLPAVAQSPATSPAAPAASVPVGPAITVVATDYHFGGLPTTVPVGTSLTLENQGAELHQMVVFRKNDGVTKTFEELLQMPGDEPLAYVTQIGDVFAVQGAIADGSVVVAQEGEYIALCFIPQGMTALPDPSASPDPSARSCDAAFHARHGPDVHGHRGRHAGRPAALHDADGLCRAIHCPLRT